MARRWGEHLKRLHRPTAQENRKGRLPPTAAAAPDGLAAATPPQGGSDWRARPGRENCPGAALRLPLKCTVGPDCPKPLL